jgi:hypothetical protein
MESLFINAGLVAGAALAAVPVILHLFMRQPPKHVIFPALRLIREKQKRSRKRLKVKNWLLLIARMALLILMALALARPRLWSKTALGDREIPTALALVFDTSLSMGYKEKDKTRLDEAKDRAREILKKTHESSRVFVVDSSEPTPPLAMSPANALKRIDALTLHAVNRPLNGAVGLAYKAVTTAEQPRHEVFVLTDLAKSAWDMNRPAEGLEEAKKDKVGVSAFVLRLSPQVIHDVAVLAAEPASDFASKDDRIGIKVRLRSTGTAAKRVAELWLDDEKRDNQIVNLTADGEAEFQLHTPKLNPGLHQGEVRIVGEPDPLDHDDRRYFTLNVQPPLKVLILADQEIDADFVANAIDPVDRRPSDPRPFLAERLLVPKLANGLNKQLSDYACVFLLNVSSLAESDWGRLNAYIRDGGGVVIGLGDRVRPESLNDPAITQLIPATLGELRQVPKETFFTFGKADSAHPLFAHNTRELLAELSNVPIYRYRKVTPAPDSTRTLLSFQDNAPALLERVFQGAKTGRVLLWTTALSRRPGNTEQERAASWNDFPLPIVGWSFFYLMNETVPYLAGLAGQRLVYEAGEDVRLPIDPSRRYTNFTIQARGAKTTDRLGEPVSGTSLIIPMPPQVGQYSVTATGPAPDTGKPMELGFSVNPPRIESQFSPLEKTDLDTLFGGKDRYALADNPERLKTIVTDVRVGRELFPLVMLLILFVVTLENALANTFYRARGAGATQPGPTRAA